ncbi:hypothetical protein SAMN05661080_01489 [Modestobacter sp. DSM 44400]|uniref:hypothetical protein n=1 Tax=Modestobacter sp. DSM 44400 TaxID=1550230 RepID=UPI000897502C|nr:hypothetical protein [Modestobacter sp. DSM 44400]SDX86574.1 hypothetical protein SAMN05661080_01489 [Modestobacter sp. DSM 44400]
MTAGRVPLDADGQHPVRRLSRRRRWVVVAASAAVLAAVSAFTVVQRTTETYAVDCLAVGAHAESAGGGRVAAGLPSFLAASEQIGPLTVHRTFDSGLPATFAASAAADDPEAGVRSFVSWKPPRGDFRGAAQGDYDEQVTAWARSVPNTGVYATAFHEPENDMTADEFVAMQRHLYRVVKQANPTVRWGPVYMAYWWDPGSPDHYVGDPAAWWPGDDAADFAGFDWYGADPEPMTGTSAFGHWYATMVDTGVPLFITEYGQYALPAGARPDPALQRARAAAIRADAAWIRAHPRLRMWVYWDDTGARGDWRLTDAASQRAWRAVASSGCDG